MTKIWQKNKEKSNQPAETYCFGDGVVADNQLIAEDVIGSLAHAKMLAKIKILTPGEFLKIKQALLEITELAEQGKFTVTAGDEDVHTKIENYLTVKLDDLGKKIHTGRSRNDQILVDLRLFTKKKLLVLASQTLETAKAFLKLAQKYEFVAMPGYTHMQKAMPSSVGLWAASFAESLIDDMKLLETAYVLNNQSPLGSGASYGVPLSIDRNLTAALLGFAKVQNNVLYCQASRGKIQLVAMQALTQMMLTMSRFAQDLLLFTTSEFDFLEVGEEFKTGSSIMPQKKNLDVMEILKAKTQEVVGYEKIVAGIVTGLPSGYSADYGETKVPLMKALEITLQSMKLCTKVVKSLKPKIEVLKEACSPEIFAAQAAYDLVKKGIPFREAYKKVALNIDNLPKFNSVKVLKISNHLGGPGHLGLVKIGQKIQNQKIYWQKKQAKYESTINSLKGSS